ncbi:response regulator [Alteribacillus bidgolensis]|uniref:Two-component system, CitB family, response regulator MalR n=1 Tax=Alteribacillus bidgolensis TaxID=930129 RepID=A0A1G8HJ03_9BACI|nr:response regulator [Alteribacillus bidgolensis]SDI06644.1 two-component system, CitB family, response regulator MalR [Alteribacillus bidgolensis]
MIKVLIVEDDPMVAKFNRVYLEKVDGFEAAGVVHNVSQAWEFLKKEEVDLLLLDVYMSKTTGLDMLIDLRKSGSPVDVIIITAANDNYSVQTALRYGAVDYLIKPFDFERFRESLLLYKKKQALINEAEAVSQEELDPFLLNREESEGKISSLPKGLTPITFARIAKQIKAWQDRKFSAKDIAEEAGISRVSVRKYLHYLVDIDVLEADVIYQSTGRPLHQFRLRIDKIDVINTFMAADKE